LFDREIVPSIGENYEAARKFHFSPIPALSTLPSIIFGFMYQPNMPIIYRELERANYTRMEKVVIRGSFSVIFMYVFAAIFGYLTFAHSQDALEIIVSKSILFADYH